MNLLRVASLRPVFLIVGGITVFSSAKAAFDNPTVAANPVPLNRQAFYGAIIVSETSAQRLIDARQLSALKDARAKYPVDLKTVRFDRDDGVFRQGDVQLIPSVIYPKPLETTTDEQRSVSPAPDSERSKND